MAYDISSVDLNKAIKEILDQYGAEVDKILDDEIQKTAKEAVKQLRKRNKSFNDRKYSSGWKSIRKTYFGGTASHVTIFNEKYYRLTHLLEKGHEVKSHGKSTGKRADSFPHISTVNNWIKTELPNALMRRIGKL